MATKQRILFVDDDAFIRLALQKILNGESSSDWEIAFAESGEAALEMHFASPFDVVVSDMTMEGLSGADVLTAVSRETPQTLRFLLTGHSAAVTCAEMASCAHLVMAKPCNGEQIRQAVTEALWLRDSLCFRGLSSVRRSRSDGCSLSC